MTATPARPYRSVLTLPAARGTAGLPGTGVGLLGEASPTPTTRPWFQLPPLPEADRWVVSTGAGLLRRGYRPEVVLAWLEEQ